HRPHDSCYPPAHAQGSRRCSGTMAEALILPVPPWLLRCKAGSLAPECVTNSDTDTYPDDCNDSDRNNNPGIDVRSGAVDETPGFGAVVDKNFDRWPR
ncbi:MAG: hypothetical protein ABMA64_25205, partial [Myxococcota bacterium]